MGLNKEIFKNKKNIMKISVVVCILIAGGLSVKPIMKVINNSSGLTQEQYVVLTKGKNINSIEVKGQIESQDDIIGIYADSNNSSFKAVQVNYKVGDKVQKGDVLAVLDKSDLLKQIEEKKEEVRISKSNAANNLKAKQEAYNNLKDQYDNNLIGNINECSKNIEAAKIDLEEKRRAYEQNKVLNESKAVGDEILAQSKAAFENAQNTYDSSISALESAKKDAEIKLNSAKDE